MSQPVLVKVYASFWPCPLGTAELLERIADKALPPTACVNLEGDLLTIAFEGLFYPVDESLAAIEAALSSDQQGRLDVLDLEAWRLTRYHIAAGAVSESGAPLNTVLANSVRPEAGA